MMHATSHTKPNLSDQDGDQPAAASPPQDGVLAGVVHRNIEALIRRQQEHDRQRRTQDRLADRITRLTGSMLFVYVHLVLYGTWIVWNLGWLGLPEFDESFVVLAMEASVEAIFLSTFVLISQNRMNAEADARADLDVQISLLTEHEVTRLITLVTAIARKLDIPEADMPEIPELEEDVRPEEVLDALQQSQSSDG
jgi:uncharacterized membrane protein